MSERTRNLPRRSCHAVPGSNERFLEKAQGIPADMVFLDLEDSVAPLEKEAAHWDGPGLGAWSGAWTPQQAALELAGIGASWCVVGGWAIDLFLRRRTRPHGDLEIAIPRQDLGAVRARLAGYRFHAVGNGEVRALQPGETPPAHTHQTWVLDEVAQLWRIDVMQEPGDRGTWVLRRDERIAAARERMTALCDGIPYLRPEGVLLYKAKAQRPKDETDFSACLPHMNAEARDWLREALARVHPGHSWLPRLA